MPFEDKPPTGVVRKTGTVVRCSASAPVAPVAARAPPPMAQAPRAARRAAALGHPRREDNSDMADTETKAVLEGGPADLPERIVPVDPPGSELKILFRGGYEHFRPTDRRQDTPQGPLPVYEWWERTEIAE